MSIEQSLTIKNYHNNGGDLRIVITSSLTSERMVGKVKIIKLTITRKPDQHSSRLGMFAFVRRRPGYQSLGFSEMTLSIDQYSKNGKFENKTSIIFYDVGVESVTGEGEEEKIIFSIGRRSNML